MSHKEECNHYWEPISTDRTKEEWVDGLGDHPEICRKCMTLRVPDDISNRELNHILINESGAEEERRWKAGMERKA